MIFVLSRHPYHTVLSILFASFVVRGASVSPAESSSLNSQCPKPTTLSVPLTLWDVGFSLQREWETSEHFDKPKSNPVASDEPATNVSSEIIQQETESNPSAKANESDFVSFEEWKRIRLAEEGEGLGEVNEELEDNVKGLAGKAPTSSENSSTSVINGSDHSENASQEVAEEHSPPTTDPVEGAKRNNDTSALPSSHHKYNYASPDCSARIHSASPQTQHSSSLLHKSRDRYMLTPCKASQHWVVVELCDDIRIQAIELSVWEFFSGIVREIRLSVGGEEDQEDPVNPGQGKEWEEVGTFIGKNVRGTQTFTLPQATSFNRFIRVDFLSFYGSEYYCPVSQLKVFGMNQMEAFKWEQKRLASGKKDREKEKERARDDEAEERRLLEQEERHKRDIARKQEDEAKEKELNELERLVLQEARRTVSNPDFVTASAQSTTLTRNPASPSTTNASTSSTNSETLPSRAENSNARLEELEAYQSSSSSLHKTHSGRDDSSESIYVVITRRLNALEGNSSLVARYIEEQSRLVRSALTRLERDWDEWRHEQEAHNRRSWEQERMRQEDRLGRIISQLEQQRSAADLDRHSMVSQLRVLSDELSYERRRGLAQMGIMIIFLGLGLASRSSIIDAVLKPLVVEARRRRSIYAKDRRYGPLTGLEIDLGSDRPPAVIGHGLPNQGGNSFNPLSPSPSSRIRPSSKSNGPLRRPGTPVHLRQRRQASLMSPSFRSVSASDSASAYLSYTPRSRAGLGGGLPAAHPRRLAARSAHLHLVDTDKSRHEVLAINERAATNGLDRRQEDDLESSVGSATDVDENVSA